MLRIENPGTTNLERNQIGWLEMQLKHSLQNHSDYVDRHSGVAYEPESIIDAALKGKYKLFALHLSCQNGLLRYSEIEDGKVNIACLMFTDPEDNKIRYHAAVVGANASNLELLRDKITDYYQLNGIQITWTELKKNIGTYFVSEYTDSIDVDDSAQEDLWLYLE